MKKTIHSRAFVALALFLSFYGASNTQADTFGTGSNQFTIDFTTIGNPGNSKDGEWGSVDYTYRIGTYEISQQQIINAVASGFFSGSSRVPSWRGTMPATDIKWYEAAAFVNWLNENSGYEPAYKIIYTYSSSGGQWGLPSNVSNITRNRRAHYFLPNENEWYKAAYGKSDGSGFFNYPTASDTTPTSVISGTNPNTAVFDRDSPASVYQSGGRSSYGTMGQGGNVWEMLESLNVYGFDKFGVMRGGSYDYNYYYMMPYSWGFNRQPFDRESRGGPNTGFRVVSLDTPRLSSNEITFPPVEGSQQYVEGLTYALAATSSSGLPVRFRSPSTNVSISGTNVTVLGVGDGTASIVAFQNGNSNFMAATPVTNILTIYKGVADVSILTGRTTYDGWSKTVSVTTTPSGLSVRVTYNGSTNRPINPGIYKVNASVTDPNYEGSGSADFSIDRGDNFIYFSDPSPVVAGSAPFPLTAMATSGLPVVLRSSSTNISLRGRLVTVLGAGTATITASQAGNTNWNAAADVTRLLVVTAPTPVSGSIAGIAIRNVTSQIPSRPNTFPLARPTNAGALVAWGDASYGQTNIPAGLTNVVQLSARGLHTLALRTNGTVSAWGWNAYGQANVPATASNAVQVAAGVNFSAALRADGTVVAWGNNNYAQTNVPAGLANVVQIAAGSDHGLALRRDGTVAAWGWNAYGQTNIPASATNVVQVAAGYFHSVALRANGTVVAWGDNTYGETNVPAGLTNVVMIATGLNHTVALRRDGTVAAWGWNNSGQTNVPAGLTGVSQIASGGNTVYAVTTNGALVTWGDNSYGQRRPPAGLTGVYQFVLGLYHGVGLRK